MASISRRSLAVGLDPQRQLLPTQRQRALIPKGIAASDIAPAALEEPFGATVTLRIGPIQILWGRAARAWHSLGSWSNPTEYPHVQPFDASASLTALEQDSTIVAVIEMSQSKWLVAAVVPGIKRQPLKKLDADQDSLLKLLHRWRKEADLAGHSIKRIVVAYEAGRDGFWLARWLRMRGVEAYVIHPTSIAVPREHRRAKTDCLDTELLLRAFLGWLRGEKRHCSMAAIPTIAEEDAKRPNRERGSLVTEQTRIVNQIKATLTRFGIRRFQPKLRKAKGQLKDLRTAEGSPLPENTRAELYRHLARLSMVREQIRAIEKARLQKLKADRDGKRGTNAMVHLIARVVGVGVETADMLVNEVFSRQFRDRKAVARYAGLTGSPDESGKRRREKGLARTGNARVRTGMIQLAWRFLSSDSNKAAHWPNGFKPERPMGAATRVRR